MARNKAGFPVVFTDAVTLNSGATAAITSAEIDTVQNGVKYRYIEIYIRMGTIASGGALTVCKLQSASANGGSYSDVTGAAITADAISNSNSSSDTTSVIRVDLQNANADRHLQMVISTDDSANSAIDFVTGVLSDGEKSPPADSNFEVVVDI